MAAVEKWNGEIRRELDGFRGDTSADFVALAWISEDDHRMRWRVASGSRSERYRTLPVRPGRELAGTVYRIGRTLAWDGTTPDLGRKRLESPIMMAEDLKAAAASPVFRGGEIQGIVLAGQRTDRVYTPDDLKALESLCERLGKLAETAGCRESDSRGMMV
ncbi:MAG: hypothetical protein BAA02_02595 [Paenibacillaceae bacterium ZCTH02-B3]|nr:MAG: hypothetical protein BAA02_02595 [Paenibacillaceae bacterium ZCTH02-B3]